MKKSAIFSLIFFAALLVEGPSDLTNFLVPQTYAASAKPPPKKKPTSVKAVIKPKPQKPTFKKSELNKNFNSKVYKPHFDSVIKSAKSFKGIKIVIGRYDPGFKNNLRKFGYDRAAVKAGLKYFHVPGKIYNSWSREKQWSENLNFINKAIRNNARVYLAQPRGSASKNSYYRKEIEILKKSGYKFSKDGTYMYNSRSRNEK